MNDYWNSVDHVTLPVKLVEGHWELLYGGSTGIRDGACGELRVAVQQIEDKAIRQRLTQTVTVKALNEGSELLVALRDRTRTQLPPESIGFDLADWPAGCTRFERIRIGSATKASKRIDSEKGGLWIRQRGIDRTELVCSGVVMPPEFDPKEARSLNHACTLLSETYETHRISHTLNVYPHVFYFEPNAKPPRWRPLDVLRNGVVADMERSIVANAWCQLEEQLGFRPIPKDTLSKRRRQP